MSVSDLSLCHDDAVAKTMNVCQHWHNEKLFHSDAMYEQGLQREF